MTTSERHIIQRQTVWLDTPGQPPSFGLQERVSAYCRNQLPGLLEILFDRFSEDDSTLRLDQLTIDVGNLSLVGLEDELTYRITQQIEEVFRQVSNQANGTTTYKHPLDKEPLTVNIKRISHAERLAGQIRYFLDNGRLPDWADTRDFGQIEEWLTTPSATSFCTELINILRNNPAQASRFIDHSSDQTLIHLVFSTSEDVTPAIVRLLVSASQQLTQQPLSVVRERYWRAAFSHPHSGRLSLATSLIAYQKTLFSDESPALFFNQLHQYTAPITGADVPAEATPLRQTLAQLIQDFQTNTITRKPNTIDQPRPANQPETVSKNESDSVDHQARSSDQQADHDQVSKPTFTDVLRQTDALRHTADRSSAQSTTRSNTPEEEALFVPLAGIVLVHPFLIPLFSEMGLLTNRQWTDEAAATKGVQALAWLATGQDYCPEYDMSLLKLLCGLPFTTLISPHLLLTDTDRGHITELLQAVIGYWEALGHISPDGLRDAFLQRTGKLRPIDAGWQLTVERKTVDILLNKFPWGYSPIKLPFMSDLLFVDWA